MSALLEADKAAKSLSGSVLTDSENPETEDSTIGSSVLNSIEKAAAAIGDKTSPELSSPEVIKLLTSMNDAINSLKYVVKENNKKLDKHTEKLDQLQKMVVGEICLNKNWRPQLSNEVSELKSVLQVEQLK